MATIFAYSRPDESFIGAGCTGTVDTDFVASSACNGAPGDPVKASGGLSIAATALAARSVGVVAVCNHNISAGGTCTVTGSGVNATITTGATQPGNNIPLNAYALVSPPVSVSALTFATAGTVAGEFWAGQLRTLERGLQVDATMEPEPPFEWEGEFGSIPPNDIMVESRKLSGSAVVTDTGLADIENWYRSTRRGILPTLIIPFYGVNDAWLVTFSYSVKIGWKHPTSGTNSIYTVSFEFKEIPRTRW